MIMTTTIRIVGDYYYSYAPIQLLCRQRPGVDSGVATPQQIPPASSAIAPATPEDQQQADGGTSVLLRCAGGLLAGRLSKRPAAGGPCRRGCAPECQGPRIDFVGLVRPGQLRRRSQRGACRHGLGTDCRLERPVRLLRRRNKYTTQLRALEKAATDNPKDAADQFLLGYQYLMIGARDNAKTQFADAVKLTPKDKLASHYLEELKSNSPSRLPRWRHDHKATRCEGKNHVNETIFGQGVVCGARAGSALAGHSGAALREARARRDHRRGHQKRNPRSAHRLTPSIPIAGTLSRASLSPQRICD